MHKSGNHWKWPKTINKILYAKDDIVQTINPPRAAGHRGQFLFDQLKIRLVRPSRKLCTSITICNSYFQNEK